MLRFLVIAIDIGSTKKDECAIFAVTKEELEDVLKILCINNNVVILNNSL